MALTVPMDLDVTVLENHTARIRNLYWCLRAIRPGQEAQRRGLYRDIERHKEVILAAGVDAELLRLFCRQFASCDEAAAKRFAEKLQKAKKFEKTLFA